MEKQRVKIFFDSRLVNNIYKILPLFEEKNIGFYDYVDSLIIEISGVEQYIDIEDTNIISLIGVLKTISCIDYEIETNHAIVKREVFKAIKLSKSISENVVI